MEFISTRLYSDDKRKKICETLDLWCDKIIKGENFSFVKFGDGEIICMMGAYQPGVDFNCDNHPYSVELGDKLLDAWNFLNDRDNIFIAEWDCFENINNDNDVRERYEYQKKLYSSSKFMFVNYEILLQTSLSESKFNFYKAIKYSNRKKIFVGPSRLSGTVDFFNMNLMIEIPIENAFSSYDNTIKQLYNEIVDDCILIFTCGMPAKSFIHKSIDYNNNITCLDMGSGLDPLFVGRTRDGQIHHNIVKNYYMNL